MSSANKKRRVSQELDEVFTIRPTEPKPLPRHAWAVRQLRGPLPHDPLVIEAINNIDAQRQWFNYYALASTTHRYLLQCVRLEADHPLASEAIRCDAPRLEQTPSLDELAREAFVDVQTALGGKSG